MRPQIEFKILGPSGQIFLPALLQKLVGDFFGFFGGNFGRFGGKFGGNFTGFFLTFRIKAQKLRRNFGAQISPSDRRSRAPSFALQRPLVCAREVANLSVPLTGSCTRRRLSSLSSELASTTSPGTLDLSAPQIATASSYPLCLKTLTSLIKESRPFLLGDHSIWSFPSVSSLSDYSIWRS